jgi:hypothetical protein
MYNTPRGADATHEQSRLTQQPSTSNAAGILQDARARRAEYPRRYRAKKKEERRAKLSGITSADKTDTTETTCNNQDTLPVRSTPTISEIGFDEVIHCITKHKEMKLWNIVYFIFISSILLFNPSLVG